jgi:DNA-binding Lrp family transcriptional regulator
MTLNNRQKKILTVIDKNARYSYSKIGKICNIPKSVVNYNISNMLEKKIIKGFTTLIDYSSLGYSELRVYINTYEHDLIKENEFVKHLKGLKDSGIVVRTLGDYDLVVSFYTKDIRLFWQKWFEILKLYKSIIREYFFNIIVEKKMFPLFAKLEFAKIDGWKKKFFDIGNKELQSFDEIDIKLIELLNQDCRKPIYEIANVLKLGSSSIIYRIKKLEEKQIILGYYTIFDFSKIDKEFCRVQFQFANHTEFEKFLDYLKVLPTVLSYAKLIGSSNDLEVDFLVENLDQLLLEINNSKIKFPGLIRDYTYLRVLDTFKWNHNPLS